MFTVVICDEHIIKDCHQKYHIYLKPFLDSEDFAFCKWNIYGDTLDDAVQELHRIIRHKKEWRAVIVNDSYTWGIDGVNKTNPFDYVDSDRKSCSFSDLEQVKTFRADEEAKLFKALSNPLTKLAIWLCGTPTSVQPVLCYGAEKDAVENVADSTAYFGALDRLGIRAIDAETDRLKELRFKKLSERFELRGELFNPPSSVITIAVRAKNMEQELAALAWSSHTEFDYSQFYSDNLYPEKLRYLIYDVSFIKERRNESLYFNFLTSLLLLATQGCPDGVLRSNRVYKLEMQVDVECVRRLSNLYNSKLRATVAKIEDIAAGITEKEKQPVDKDEAEEYFESNVSVPIEVVSRESRENLMAKHNGIGLSKDCPTDEYVAWDDQYHTINKYFIRFLREPRRAVETATKKDFRKMNEISDERALRLSEYQREDVMYQLEEEEKNMVSTQTTQLFNTSRYSEMMREYDKDIRDEIAQRMTRKTALFVGLFATIAYLIGFLPLLFSNINTARSFLSSLAVTGAVLGVFLAVGAAILIFLRFRLVKKIKNFNSGMSDILSEIEGSVNSFSKYLGHACNVMREFSVLNFSESSYKKKKYILKNHKRIILKKIDEVNELFAGYIDSDGPEYIEDTEPYNYDFTLLREYDYDMPLAEVRKDIDYMQPGNRIVVPVDYVESITLTREELYD